MSNRIIIFYKKHVTIRNVIFALASPTVVVFIAIAVLAYLETGSLFNAATAAALLFFAGLLTLVALIPFGIGMYTYLVYVYPWLVDNLITDSVIAMPTTLFAIYLIMFIFSLVFTLLSSLGVIALFGAASN